MKAKNRKGQSDEQLVSRLQRGDKNAMTGLYLKYYMVVFNKCLSFTKNTYDASDMTQDVMLRVMEKINSFNGLSKFSTWLYSITFNYCMDQMRKNQRKHFTTIDNSIDLSDNYMEEKIAKRNQEQITNCADKVLAEINKDDNQLLIMKYLKNKSIQELQEIYQISGSAIKMRLLRARKKAVHMLKFELVA